MPNGARTRRDRKHLGEGDFRPRSGGEISEVLIENYRLFIHHMETRRKMRGLNSPLYLRYARRAIRGRGARRVSRVVYK